MPPERIVVDGLWRCLCPSVDVSWLSMPLSLSCLTRQRPIIPYSTTASSPQGQYRRNYRLVATDVGMSHGRNYHETVEKSRIDYLKRLAKRSPWIPSALFEGVDSFSTKLERIPTNTIYAALQELQVVEGTYFSIVKLVEYLVKERAQRPNAALYECLIRANVDKKYGSAEIAGQLLKEMESMGIPMTPQVYQAILEVTAVHPDYTLRSGVLFEMKNRWFNLTPNDEISVILGLLRDRQFELALDRLEAANQTPANIPPWLLDIFIYTLGSQGFQAEALSLLRHRLRVANAFKSPVSLNTWYFLLDVFSRDGFYPGVKYVWDRSVALGYVNPSDAVVVSILNTASTYGDVDLALRAAQLVSARGGKLDIHHYEALVHAHVQQNDLQKAFVILCIMAKAGLSPDLSTCRSIFRVLHDSPSATRDALTILHQLRLQYHVPSAAFNVVLEATEFHHGFKVALDLYRTVRQICVDGPDIETYHLLLRHCTMRKSMNFLLAEMEAFSIKPTKVTYDHVIRICTIQDDYDPVFKYVEMLRSLEIPGLPEGPWMSRGSALALIRRCILARDSRVESIITECRRRGISVDSEIQALVREVHKLESFAAKEQSMATAPVESANPSQNRVFGSMTA
ncbi:hypothetical protein F4809DRAFT_475109 [Biscogniauxia mediterranea]|nr:hypothetical protein F4809DRAFT_475109 [Biscogniauxia mediterranea]